MVCDPRPVILSLEQALSMPYGTLRFVHQGWRVIKIEPTPRPGRKSKGDPNRYVGKAVAGEDRHSYFVAPNVGKEAMALDLKRPEGQAVLRRLIRELPVDVFCTNTMPAHHFHLGIDGASLSAVKDDLIWCAISAMGLDHPELPGYDPVLQALCGYMDLTGYRNGPPLQCGLPLIDLKAGDEAFAQILLALLERERTGRGKIIDISMARAAASWLHTFLPMIDMGSSPAEIRRNANEHRQFFPVDGYPTRDGHIYLAIGSDVQWARLVAEPMFQSLAQPSFETNEGRREGIADLRETLSGITRTRASTEVGVVLASAGIPHAPITAIEDVADLDFVQSDILRTRTPDGREVRLPPAAVDEPHLEAIGGRLPFAPSYGENTDSLLAEIGLEHAEIASLRESGVVS